MFSKMVNLLIRIPLFGKKEEGQYELGRGIRNNVIYILNFTDSPYTVPISFFA